MTLVALPRLYFEHGREIFSSDLFFTGGQVETVSLVKGSCRVNDSCLSQPQTSVSNCSQGLANAAAVSAEAPSFVPPPPWKILLKGHLNPVPGLNK